MSHLPLVDSKALEKLLLSIGFEIKRQKGSHVFYRHPDGRYTTIPHHKGPEHQQVIDQRDIEADKTDYRRVC